MKELFRQLKWAWQRVYRGWDDRVIWSIDWYLCEMLPVWLRTLREITGEPPVEFCDELDNVYSIGESQRMWSCILDEIADGFEASLKNILNMESDDTEGDMEKHDKTMDLFKEHFFTLWY